MRNTRALLTSLFLIFAVGTPALAQEDHVVNTSELQATVSEQVEAEDADRRAVMRVLERSEVREVAESMDLDLTDARDAVATLEGDELQRLADRSRDVEKALAGGDTYFTISATALIIVLLVLIVLLVA